MKYFSKNEFKAIVVIFAVLAVIAIPNFQAALRRARDMQRRQDLGSIHDALGAFHKDFGFFPPASEDGRIVACKGDNLEEAIKKASETEEFDLQAYFAGLRACRWGEDALIDASGQTDTKYLQTIYADPRLDSGISYKYVSNIERYQIFAYLEGEEEEIGHSDKIVARQLKCGSEICNFGRAYGATPLEKPLKEYQNGK